MCRSTGPISAVLAVLCIGMCSFAADWHADTIHLAEQRALHAVAACSRDGAWAVGSYGTVLRRSGTAWHNMDDLVIGQDAWDFTGVDIVDRNTVWIVGEKREDPDEHRGVLLTTQDGGQSWDMFLPMPAEKYPATPFHDVCLSATGCAWIAAGMGYVLKSDDGGRNWKVTLVSGSSFADHFQSIWAEGADKAWACSDNSGGIARTGDGGATWQTREPFPAQYSLPEIDPGQRYSRVAAALWASAFDTAYVALSEGRIAKTADGGNAWDVHTVAPDGVWFRDVWGRDRFVWAVGTSGEIYFSDTKGELWKREFGGADFHLNDVDMVDDLSGYGWAVGTNGTILRRVPRAFPDLSSEANQPAPFVDVVWELNPEAPVDSFQLLRNFENRHEDPSGYLVTIEFLEGLGRYTYTDHHQYRGPHEYFYWVKTFYTDNQVDIQGPLAVQAHGAMMPEFPRSPDNIAASRTPDGVFLTWGSTGSPTYRVYRSKISSGPFTYIGETSQSRYLDREVDEAATYFYLLRAAGAELTSPDSPLASVGPQDESYDVSTEIDPAGTYYDVIDRIAYFSWNPVSDHLLGGYWVSLNDLGSARTLMNSSAVSRDWYGVRYSASPPTTRRLQYGILPMDRISRLSQWDDYDLPVGVCNTARNDATAWNNAAKLVGREGLLHLVYSDRVAESDRIYYACSDDGGLFWSQPVDLGEGLCPALAANPSGLYSVWLDDGNSRIIYARMIGEIWEKATIFETSGWLTPPSIAVDEENCYLAIAMRDSVCWGMFPLHHIGSPEWHRIADVSGPAPSLRASIDIDSRGMRHVSYSRNDGEVYYWSDYTAPGSVNISRSTSVSRFPALDVNGSVARVVWEEQVDSDWVVRCWQLFGAPDTSLWEVSCVGECGPGNSSLQPTIRGNRVMWVKSDGSTNYNPCLEVYGSRFRYDSSFAWEKAQNHSQLPWSPSLYPQMLDRPQKFLAVWTEGVSPHHWIRFEEIGVPDRNVAFYKLGGRLPAVVTVARDGYTWLGERAYMKVDYSDDELIYRIEGLEPDSIYTVGVGFYQEDEPISELIVRADGDELKTVEVPAGVLSYAEQSVPLSITCDGVVTIGIRNSGGGLAVASHISIDYDTPGGSGPQNAAHGSVTETASVSFDVAPNPFRKSVTLKLTTAHQSRAILIHDATGRLVNRLPVRGCSVEWDGRSSGKRVLPAGVYFARTEDAPVAECVKVLKLE